MFEYLIWFLCGTVAGALLVWITRVAAIRMDWLDVPNERSLHTQPTPRIGGFGFLLPMVSGLGIMAVCPAFAFPVAMTGALAPALVVASISFLDDFKSLSRWIRLLGHFLCAILILWIFRESWQHEPLPLVGPGLPVVLSGILLVLWFVGLTNAYNFMDGIDGIGGIQGILALVGWCTVFLWGIGESTIAPANIIILLLLSGGLVGFLFHNWAPANIFMGDIGSTFLGFFLAGMPLVAVRNGLPLDKALEAGIFFVWPFIADSGHTFIRRLIARDPIFEPHRTHLYQKLAASFQSREQGHRMTSLVYGFLGCAGLALYWVEGPLWARLLALAALWAATVIWIQLLRGKRDPVPRYVGPNMYEIYLAPPEVAERERRMIHEALDSGYIAPVGPQIDQFEVGLSRFLKLENMQVVNSGTAALHLGLRALGVGPGDCVLCPDLTFIASVNPVRYLGAEPVLIDVAPDNWAMETELVREAIRTLRSEGRCVRAMVVVHAYGIPAPMSRLMAIAREEGIRVLEDCAGAFGATINGQSVGSFGDAAAFSFNGNKVLTTSGGGALYINDESLREQARSWANQGKPTGARNYTHETLGYNYRLSNVCAAIGIGQLDTVEKRLDRKVSIYSNYQKLLSSLDGIHFMPEPEYGKGNYWLSCIGTGSSERTKATVVALQERLIEAVEMWKPMHLQEVNRGVRCFGGANSEHIYSRFLSLPSGTQLTDKQIQRICGIIREV